MSAIQCKKCKKVTDSCGAVLTCITCYEKLERELTAANAELVMWRDGNIVTEDVQQMKARIAEMESELADARSDISRLVENMEGPSAKVLAERADALARIAELENALRKLANRSAIYCEQDECCARRSEKFNNEGRKAADEDCIDCQIEKAKG